jgi:hypothetical protein
MTVFERLVGSPMSLPRPLFPLWVACLVGAPVLLIVVPAATMLGAALLALAAGLSVPFLAGEPLRSWRRIPVLLSLLALVAASVLLPWQAVRPTPSFISGALLVVAIVLAGTSVRQRAGHRAPSRA